MLNIIIPAYKARDTITDTLNSLVAQTKKMFTVTIVQDCDGEDYTDIVEEYRRRGLSIFIISTDYNGGPGLARQKGIDASAMYDYIMFVDADDMLNPRAVEILYTECMRTKSDIITSSFFAERLNEPGMPMNVEDIPVTWCHGKIYRIKYLTDNDIRFIPELRLNEDSYFNLVAMNCTKNKAKIPLETYIWRANPKSLTRAESGTQFFKKSYQQYIYSQIYGLQKIYSINNELDPYLTAATLINIYDHMMKAIYFDLPLDEIRDELKKCLDAGLRAVIENITSEAKFWEYVSVKLQACTEFDNNLIFYKQRFNEWVNEYILQE